jgi:glutamate/tyrosine decarboxylase-like PLP-dependent enzyme
VNIPDYISPVVAYRVWRWKETGLQSLNGEPWLPGQHLEARCRVAPAARHIAQAANEVPHRRCTCGIYAAKNSEHLRQIGYADGGGSMANLISLSTARHAMLREKNISSGVAYCSDQTHSSVERGMRVLGFETSQLQKLPSDDSFRISVAHLRRRIADDRSAGRVPFCVIANAGTTNTGAVDPLVEVGELCKQEGLWLHVDGAYGAPAVLCEKGALREKVTNLSNLLGFGI